MHLLYLHHKNRRRCAWRQDAQLGRARTAAHCLQTWHSLPCNSRLYIFPKLWGCFSALDSPANAYTCATPIPALGSVVCRHVAQLWGSCVLSPAPQSVKCFGSNSPGREHKSQQIPSQRESEHSIPKLGHSPYKTPPTDVGDYDWSEPLSGSGNAGNGFLPAQWQ